MNKYIFLLSFLCALLVTSCGKQASSQNEEAVTSVNEQTEASSSFDYLPNTYDSTGSGTYTEGSTAPQTTRSQAFRDAFNSGKRIGYSDGMNGVNDGDTYASAYTDEWIKQAFLQGYEMGQSEAASKGGRSSYYVEEEEYDVGEEYYYDDEY